MLRPPEPRARSRDRMVSGKRQIPKEDGRAKKHRPAAASPPVSKRRGAPNVRAADVADSDDIISGTDDEDGQDAEAARAALARSRRGKLSSGGGGRPAKDGSGTVPGGTTGPSRQRPGKLNKRARGKIPSSPAQSMNLGAQRERSETPLDLTGCADEGRDPSEFDKKYITMISQDPNALRQ